MEQIIKTPLMVVYLDDGFHLSVERNLNLCRASQVWGVAFYDEIAEENIFLAKTNGADISLSDAYDWCHKAFEGYYFAANDVTLYGGLPHYDELMSLVLGNEDDVNKTMAIFRKHGIVADNLFAEPYLTFSDEIFENAHDLHLRRLFAEKERNEAKMFKAVSLGDGANTVIDFSQMDLRKFDCFHTRVFLHQV